MKNNMEIVSKEPLPSSIPTICVVGAGFSGICAAIKLTRKLGLSNFTIIDENHDFGGTWLMHTYPNCGCDIPSYFYSFSFEPNPNWSSIYGKQEEILAYLQKLAKKYDLYSKARFNSQIQSMTWVSALKKWKVEILDKKTETVSEMVFDFVIAGPGGLRVPNIPEQFKGFEGPLIHSAEWDASVNLKGKRVAVVGCGTSAVQIIPGIVDNVTKLYSFQRRPAWVIPKLQKKISPGMQSTFEKHPVLQRSLRNFIFLTQECIFSSFKSDSMAQAFSEWMGKTHLKNQIPNNPELREKLTPNYSFGCKRVAPSNDYYPALTQSHVEVVTDKVLKVQGHTITTEDGEERSVDVIILATGYQQIGKQYFRPAKIFVDNGSADGERVDLLDTFRQGPEHYLGIMSENFPNFFWIMGPNSAAMSSCVFPIECQTNWVMQVVRRMMTDGNKEVNVKKGVQEEYMRKVRKNMKGLVYGGSKNNCNSWFVDGKSGLNPVLHPGGLIDYWKKSRKVKFDYLHLR